MLDPKTLAVIGAVVIKAIPDEAELTADAFVPMLQTDMWVQQQLGDRFLEFMAANESFKIENVDTFDGELDMDTAIALLWQMNDFLIRSNPAVILNGHYKDVTHNFLDKHLPGWLEAYLEHNEVKRREWLAETANRHPEADLIVGGDDEDRG